MTTAIAPTNPNPVMNLLRSRESYKTAERTKLQQFLRQAALNEARGDGNDNDPEQVADAIEALDITADAYQQLVATVDERLKLATLAIQLPAINSELSAVEADVARERKAFDSLAAQHSAKIGEIAMKRDALLARQGVATDADTKLRNSCRDPELLVRENRLSAQAVELHRQMEALKNHLEFTNYGNGTPTPFGKLLQAQGDVKRLRVSADNPGPHAARAKAELEDMQKKLAGHENAVQSLKNQMAALQRQHAEVVSELAEVSALKSLPDSVFVGPQGANRPTVTANSRRSSAPQMPNDLLKSAFA